MSDLPIMVSLLVALAVVVLVIFAIELVRRFPSEPVAMHESLPVCWRISGSALVVIGFLIRPLRRMAPFHRWSKVRSNGSQAIAVA